MATNRRRSLLSSAALIQVPWVRISIGEFTFGVFSKTKTKTKNSEGFYSAYNVQYPNYIQSLTIKKINGQVNQYTLSIRYPVRPGDDPNFFEKVFSSVSKSRKIVFSYGDSSMPAYCYKDEEAIITDIKTSFSFGNGGTIDSVIGYTISAVSSSALGKTGSFTFIGGRKKPSDEIKRIFLNKTYGLQSLFTGMSSKNLDDLIAGGDKEVEIETKINISPLDYITYLVSCMLPATSGNGTTVKDIYILTIHDETVYDTNYQDSVSLGGPYFKVTRTSYVKSQNDAYEVDIGYNTNTIVTNFQIDNNENVSLYYEYTKDLYPEEYVRRLNNNGQWEDIYAPTVTSNNERRITKAEDISWYTKVTQYPISGSITIQGLLRPAQLLQYIRINVIFPGGIGANGERKHVSSGLYIVTSQQDVIDTSGYRTTLGITKISGDDLSTK